MSTLGVALSPLTEKPKSGSLSSLKQKFEALRNKAEEAVKAHEQTESHINNSCSTGGNAGISMGLGVPVVGIIAYVL